MFRMKSPALPLFLVLATLAIAPARSAEEKPASQDAAVKTSDGKVSGAAAAAKDNAGKSPSLRRPGFVFMELNTKKVDEYVAFFADVMGFKETMRKGRYVVLQTEVAELTIMDPDLLLAGHPFYKTLDGKTQGMGVEMGFVVADVDKAFAAAVKHEGWRISAGIGRRPWGARDFRVVSPDGYYLRFTELSE